MKRLFYLGLLLLLPAFAFAGENAIFRDYYTWGGTIDVVAEAFRKLALLTSDSKYQGLFYGIGVLGFLAGSIGIILYSWARGHPPTWAWLQLLLVLLVGGFVYFGFLKKKDVLYLYDQTTSETTYVSDVPDGVIFLSSFFNRIENGLTEMIDRTSLDGLSYKDGTGGVAMQLLIDAAQIPLTEGMVSIHLLNSLTNYFKDCYLYNVALGHANSSKLYNPPNNDLMSALSEGVHPVVYTLFFNDQYPGGITVSCQVAWEGGRAENGVTTVDGLRAQLTAYTEASPWVAEYKKALCASVGFDVNDPQALTRCTQIFTATLSRILSGGLSNNVPGARMDQFLRNRIIAQGVYRALQMTGSSSQIQLVLQREFQSAGIGMAVAANRYIPALKAAITAIFLGILPLLFLFIFTPLWKKVLALSAGSFAFLCMWGVCDALVHSFIAERIVGLFKHVRATGIDAMVVGLPQKSLEALSLFGIMRMATIFFAGTITKMLFGFGGHMLAHLASSLMGRIEATAARAGQTAFLPEAKAGLMESVVSAPEKIQVPHWGAGWSGSFDAWLWRGYLTRTTAAASQIRVAERGIEVFKGQTPYIEASSKAATIGTIAGAAEYTAVERKAAQKAVDMYQLKENLSELRLAKEYGEYEGFGSYKHPMETAEETSKLQTIERVEHAEALKEAALHLGMKPEQFIKFWQRLNIGGTAGQIKAGIERGLSPYQAAFLYARTGEHRKIGEALALTLSHEYAQSHLGFKGSFHDFVDWLSTFRQQRELGQITGIQEVANRYFGGDVAAAERAWRFVEGLRGTGEYRGAELIGFNNYVKLRMDETLNEQAKFLALGYASAIVRGDWKSLKEHEGEISRLIQRYPKYQMFLARHLNDLEFVVKSPEEANNLYHYIQTKKPDLVGKVGLSPQDFVEGKVGLALGVDQKGQIGVARLGVQKGGDVKVTYQKEYTGGMPEAFVSLPAGETSSIAKLDVVKVETKGDTVYLEGFLPGTDYPVKLTLPKGHLYHKGDTVIVNTSPGTIPTVDLDTTKLASYLLSPQINQKDLNTLSALLEPQFRDSTRRTDLIMNIAKGVEQVMRMQARTTGQDQTFLRGSIGIGSGVGAGTGGSEKAVVKEGGLLGRFFGLNVGAASSYTTERGQEYNRLVQELQDLAGRSRSSLEFLTGARNLISQTIQGVQKRTTHSGELGEGIYVVGEKIGEGVELLGKGLVGIGRSFTEAGEKIVQKVAEGSEKTGKAITLTSEGLTEVSRTFTERSKEPESWRSEKPSVSTQKEASINSSDESIKQKQQAELEEAKVENQKPQASTNSPRPRKTRKTNPHFERMVREIVEEDNKNETTSSGSQVEVPSDWNTRR